MSMPGARFTYGDEPQTTATADQAPQPTSISLRVFGEGIYDVHPLPVEGEVTIGRSQQADIRIEHPSVSRLHAVLRLGNRITVEDQGSANGTSVGGARLTPHQPAEIAAGEPIDLGSIMIVVQAASVAARRRRLWTHGYFEARLEEECQRAGGSGASFALARIGVSGPGAGEALAGLVGEEQLLAEYGPDEFELLMPDCDEPRARQTLERLERRLGERGLRVRKGLAVFPADGRTPETLMAQACRGVWGHAAEGALGNVIVADPAMQRLYRLVERVAAGNVSVLLLGETGVGKEVVAEAVHRLSPRAKQPFLRLNCAAFTETLLESELFGYEKGAFSGAAQTKPGLLETAQGGTVFLDEVGEMPLSLQAKLLRVIEERRVMRVGGLKDRPIDVRFVAATNRDLSAEIVAGRFRQDLYYRLDGISLVIPPLRDRRGEIEELARLFIARATPEGTRPPQLTPAALELLRAYEWPGNIRELRNVIERAVLLSVDGVIAPEQLPVDKMRAGFVRVAPPAVAAASAPVPVALQPEPPRGDDDGERQRVIEALQQCAGNQTHAARLLGISRGTLLARLNAYNLPRPRKPKP
jgi:DNA-binding NtrC family response regulator